MTRNIELTDFVNRALTQGVPRTQIEAVLVQAGWTVKQARDALASFADVTFAVPVPRPRAYTEAREAFLYGVMFVALYVAAYNLGAALFVLIEQAFPSARATSTLREAIRWPVSLLVVALPVWAYQSRAIRREVRADPSKRDSEIRSKLTYLTLFACAAVMIGVLAGVVYGFLGGELTIRFILKSLTAAGIAALVFQHYLRDMRPGTTAVAAADSSS